MIKQRLCINLHHPISYSQW